MRKPETMRRPKWIKSNKGLLLGFAPQKYKYKYKYKTQTQIQNTNANENTNIGRDW